MYPTTIVTWEDQSDILTPEITSVRNMPLYAAVITADKGTEDWVRLNGQEWFDMYAVANSVDFARHGQPLLQVAGAVEAGAEILCKRVVAEDAMLANLAVIATTSIAPAQGVLNANMFGTAAAANEYLGVTDAADKTMFVKLANPIGTDRYLIKVIYPNNQTLFAMFGDGTDNSVTNLYWDAASNAQYDFGKTETDPVVSNGTYRIAVYTYKDDTLAAGTYPTTLPTNTSLLMQKSFVVSNGEGVGATTEDSTQAGKVATTVTYSYKSATGCKTMAEVVSAIWDSVEADRTAAAEGTSIHPLWIIADNGRGVSKKRIRITPNHNISKNEANYFLYDLEVIEAGKRFDTIHFCIDPSTISGDKNQSLQYQVNANSSQIRAYQFDDELVAFMDEMIAGTNMDEAEAIGMDLLFGTTKKQKKIPGIIIDNAAGIDLSMASGQILMNGDNGSFGDAPIANENYGALVAKAFAGYVVDAETGEASILTTSDGVYDTRIYDVDRYKIDAIFDANYPAIVKRAIEQLATFREDFMFFRDMGTGLNTLDLILAADYDNLKTPFAATYCTYYDVIDPYSKKQITVTINYSLAKQMVQQFNNGRNLPIAGIKYGFVITEIVKNTLGFAPAICPGVNQKEDLYDARINYATYIDDELVIESLYTSQEKYSQLSFANNVLAVQEVIKRIRTRCPALRYTFIDGDDLAKYRAEVDEVIAPFKSNFKTLQLKYMQDAYYTENKIFYATLAVQFRDFVQTEYFKVVALGSQVDAASAIAAL